jgi:multidrug efflux pump subunit AcrA (membrane-fusion protein)
MMTANAEILIDEHKNVLAVPEQAISYDAQKHAFVNVPDPRAKDGMRKVAVTVGLEKNNDNHDDGNANGSALSSRAGDSCDGAGLRRNV